MLALPRNVLHPADSSSSPSQPQCHFLQEDVQGWLRGGICAVALGLMPKKAPHLLGLVFCYCCLEILNNFLTGPHIFILQCAPEIMWPVLKPSW